MFLLLTGCSDFVHVGVGHHGDARFRGAWHFAFVFVLFLMLFQFFNEEVSFCTNWVHATVSLTILLYFVLIQIIGEELSLWSPFDDSSQEMVFVEARHRTLVFGGADLITPGRRFFYFVTTIPNCRVECSFLYAIMRSVGFSFFDYALM